MSQSENTDYECEDSGAYEIDLKLPDGRVKPTFSFISTNLVSVEKHRILLQEGIVMSPDDLVLIRHSAVGRQEIMEETKTLGDHDLDSCSLIEVDLKSRAKNYEGRSPNPDLLNYSIKENPSMNK